MFISPSSPRCVVRQLPTGLSASIPAWRNWFVVLFLCVWLSGWTFSGVSAGRSFVKPGDDQLFEVLWLGGWLLGELFALSIITWQLAGKEEISISELRLVHRVSAFGIGRTREFATAQVEDTRVKRQPIWPWFNQQSWVPPWFGTGYGTLAFDYGAKTYLMGTGLEEAEAKYIIAQLAKRLPRRFTSPIAA
jgi:hypothetical protein